MANEQTPARSRVVADIMSRPVVTALGDETIAQAAARMAEHRVGSVVVVDGHRPVGILTERDLVRLAGAGAPPTGTKVAEWMTAAPDTVGPDQSVDDAWRGLAEHGYRHIPVVADDCLMGLVSMRDLMNVAQLRPAFDAEIRPLREIPPATKQILPDLAAGSAAVGPLDGLRTGLSAVAAAIQRVDVHRPGGDVDGGRRGLRRCRRGRSTVRAAPRRGAEPRA